MLNNFSLTEVSFKGMKYITDEIMLNWINWEYMIT